MKSTEKFLEKFKSFHDEGELVSVPSVEDSGVIALNIVESIHGDLTEKEQAIFIAGFQESVKYLRLFKSHTQNCI